MAIKRCESSIDVVKAAKIRIRNVFQNGLPVYMSFSGGKDSLCMAQLVMELVQAGEINPAQLTVQFIDEEAIFPCMEDKVKEWRKKFMLIGAKFEWYCLEVNKDCKAIYEGLISGDPKLRSYRALYQRIYGKYITEAKKKEGMTNG